MGATEDPVTVCNIPGLNLLSSSIVLVFSTAVFPGPRPHHPLHILPPKALTSPSRNHGFTPLHTGCHAYLQGLRKRANKCPRTQNAEDCLVLERCVLVAASKLEGFSGAKLSVAHEAWEAAKADLSRLLSGKGRTVRKKTSP